MFLHLVLFGTFYVKDGKGQGVSRKWLNLRLSIIMWSEWSDEVKLLNPDQIKRMNRVSGA